jgi:hypothetical protein
MVLKIIIYHLDVLKGDVAEVDEAIFQFVEGHQKWISASRPSNKSDFYEVAEVMF